MKKRTYRKVPKDILAKAKSFGQRGITVSVAMSVSTQEIAQGRLAKLGIKSPSELPLTMIPSKKFGKFAVENLDGKVVVRKDLPKVPKTFEFEAPSWGDWSRGSHTVSYQREVYQRIQIPPHNLRLKVEPLKVEQPEGFVLLKFSIEKSLTSGAKLNEDELLFCLNLLGECVGLADVYPADAKDSDYLATMELNWEILPPGECDVIVSKFLSGKRKVNKDLYEKVNARYKLLAEMKPEAFIKGTKGFTGYFGAKFSDELVVFEHIGYGNAIYVMCGDWKSLSQKSKTELLNSQNKNFHRVVHRKGWEEELKQVVKDLLRKAA